MALMGAMDFYDWIIPIVSVLFIALFCAYINSERSFSLPIFMGSIAIGFCVIIWVGLFPVFGFGIVALCIIGLLFSGGGETE